MENNLNLMRRCSGLQLTNNRSEKVYKDLQFGSSNSIASNRGTDMFVSSIPEPLSQLIQQIKRENPEIPDLILYPASETNPELSMIRPGYYQYGDFQILSGFPVYTDDYVRVLKQIAPLQLSSAPQLIQYLKFPETDTSIVITRMPGCDVRTLRSYEESAESVTKDKREQFLNEMRKLLDANLYHPHMLKPLLWDVTSEEKPRIILDQWDRLQKISNPAEKSEILSTITEYLYPKVKKES